jgi:methylglutaconyl-CoA hydratase
MNQGSISSQIEGVIAHLTFSHPAGNSCTSSMLSELTSQINQLSEDASIKAILLRSPEHTAFCAGANLREVVSLSNIEEAKEFFMGFARLILAIKNCPKLVIARVHSKAVGGGVGIIAACDLAFATRKSSLRLSEINLGIAPLVIAPALIRKIGVSAFSTLSLNPTNWLDHNWGYERGLFTQKFDSLEALDEELKDRLEKISDWSPQAMKALKSTLWESTDSWESLLESKAESTAQLALSDYTQEQLKKYKK